MKKYEIESFHHVCDIDFEKGESDQESSYDSIQTVYASDWEEAIDIYLEKHLYTKLNFYDLELNVEYNCFECSFLQTSYVNDVVARDMFLKPVNTTFERSKEISKEKSKEET